jgi:hypothetical protein
VLGGASLRNSALNNELEKIIMNRVSQLDPASATGKTKQLFDGVRAKLGVVPNLFRVRA